MDAIAPEIDLVKGPSGAAKFAVATSVGTLLVLVLCAASFGIKIGGYKSDFARAQSDIAILEEKKADKELIASKLESLGKQNEAVQKTLDEIKDELKRRRSP